MLAVTLIFMMAGYMYGFLVGVFSLAGLIAGAAFGARLLPQVFSGSSNSSRVVLSALVAALLFGLLVAMGLRGFAMHVRSRLKPPLTFIDGVLGAGLAGCLALGVFWLAGVAALHTPSAKHFRHAVQKSYVLGQINQVLPPSGSIFGALERLDPFPEVRGPMVDVKPPNPSVVSDPDTVAAADSVVRILGTACGLGTEGSGWVVAPGLVVTNAHVVAGQQDTVVERGGKEPRLSAELVYFEPRNDLAILRVADLDSPTLKMASRAERGTAGSVLGYPLNGPYDAHPARIGLTEEVISNDSYGRGPIRRQVTSLRGLVRSGNSGGPVVDTRGRVLATVFAAKTSKGPRGGYAIPNSVVAAAVGKVAGPVDPGPCAL